MENPTENHQEVVDQIYQYAANMMANQQKNAYEVKTALMAQGLNEEAATIVVENVEKQIKSAQKSKANKDMIYGALWCIGGTVGTLANTGFIFWGAILFGGIQFFRGLSNAI